MIVSAEEFVRLRLSDEHHEYARAANDNASESVWLEVIQEYPEMRKWVAHNKTIPISILQILANDVDSAVRSMVARKRKLPADIIERLAQDSDASVRFAIACNKSTPRYVLEMLLNDDWENIVERAGKRLTGFC